MFLKQIQDIFKQYPDNNAFCFNGVYYSYADFQKRIAYLQELLQNVCDSDKANVGIIASETIDDYAAIFACWFLGCSYTPISAAMPKERAVKIIADAGLNCLVGQLKREDAYYVDFPIDISRMIESGGYDGNDREIKFVESQLQDTAYTLFTSGSTGVPKGVPISFGNIESFLDSYNALNIPTSAEDRYLQMFELGFDVSVASYIVPLLSGACVYPILTSGIKYLNVIKVLNQYNITIASIVPSILKYLQTYFHEISLPALKCCILTAEAIPEKLVFDWKPCIPNATIFNLYGPTEATIWCTGYKLAERIEDSKSYNDMVIIGKPFKNVDTLIVDNDQQQVLAGEKGELLLCSTQLTNGYVNNPERNEIAFVTINGNRYYKTGDVCFFDEQGDIHYCGRADDQVKVQGFRVELGEIAMILSRNFPDMQCVPLKYEDQNKITQIGLVIEGESSAELNLNNKLKEYLPHYMVPQRIIYVKELPQNASNKIDKVKLAALFSYQND